MKQRCLNSQSTAAYRLGRVFSIILENVGLSEVRMWEMSTLCRPAGSPGSHTSTARKMSGSRSRLRVQMCTLRRDSTLRSAHGERSGLLLFRSEACNLAPSTLSCRLSGIDIAVAVQGVSGEAINLSLSLI